LALLSRRDNNSLSSADDRLVIPDLATKTVYGLKRVFACSSVFPN
jgi:hypothetical protein